MIKIKDRLNIYVLFFLNALIASIVFYLLYKFNFILNIENTISIIILLIVSCFLFFISSLIKINNQEIKINFLFFKTIIRLDDINEIEIEKINTLKKFAGYGYRININGDIGYVLGESTCLKIVTEKKTYYASFNKKYLKTLLDNQYIKIKQPKD